MFSLVLVLFIRKDDTTYIIGMKKTSKLLKNSCKGSRDGTVVRALASHQFGPGSISGVDIICGMSLLLVLVPAPRV